MFVPKPSYQKSSSACGQALPTPHFGALDKIHVPRSIFWGQSQVCVLVRTGVPSRWPKKRNKIIENRSLSMHFPVQYVFLFVPLPLQLSLFSISVFLPWCGRTPTPYFFRALFNLLYYGMLGKSFSNASIAALSSAASASSSCCRESLPVGASVIFAPMSSPISVST